MAHPRALILGVLVACTAGGDPVSRADLLRDTVAHAILPTHAALSSDGSRLADAVSSLCAAPDAASADGARAAWLATKGGLKRIEAWSFGPYRFFDIDIAREVDKWPGIGANIDAAISAAEVVDADYVLGLDYRDRIRGVPALGYLLFADGDAAATAARLQAEAKRCEYAAVVAGLVRDGLDAYTAAWSPDGGDYAGALAGAGAGSVAYATEQAAITALVGGMAGAAGAVAAGKLGAPLGAATGGEPAPELVESPHAGTSIDDAVAVIDGIALVYDHDGVDLSALVASRSAAGAVDTAVKDAIEHARARVAAVPRPLEASVVVDTASVQAAIDATDALSAVLLGDLSTLLGINPTTIDGDND